MTSGASRGRRALAGVAAAGAAVLTLSVAACGGVSGLARAAGVTQPATPAAGSASSRAASSGAWSSGAGSPSTPSPGQAKAGASGIGTSGDAPSATATSPGAASPTAPGHADPFAGVELYLAQRAGTVLAAVYDVRTGQSWRLGDGPAQHEASVVKLDILEALLSGSDGAGLSPDSQGLARQMIEDSDNDAATSLWYAAGGTAGLASYNAKAGLTRTTPSDCVVCAGFPWPGWGLTTTVPYDQITLLKQLITPGPLLTTGDREYALSLLENVTPGQAWGVSGGVPAGVTVALKNGWLPLNDDNTDWQINSEGWVSGDGRDYLISVLTTGDPSERYGIDTIDELSALLWTAMR